MPLLSRLYRDLAELHETPYPGVAVFTDDADMLKFCLVLTPPSGPWKDLSLHFDVEIPDRWPASPPRVKTSIIGINHPNFFGDYICCDLLKEQDWLERGYTGGYTPALTLRGLFFQFLTFFSSTKVEQDYGSSREIGDYMQYQFFREEDIPKNVPLTGHRLHQYIPMGRAIQDELQTAWRNDHAHETVIDTYTASGRGKTTHKVKSPQPHPKRIHMLENRNPRWDQTFDLIRHFKCKRCPYGSSELPHHRTSTPPLRTRVPRTLLRPPPRCFLENIDDDVLSVLIASLPSESVISFSKAYPRMAQLVDSLHTLLQRELQCFFLRTPLQESILGIGVQFDAGPRMFSSDFDWISATAFDVHQVRKSIQKREFNHFLPLAFSRSHFERALPQIWTRLAEMDRAVRQATAALNARTRRDGGHTAPPKHPYQTVDVIYRMMNNIVVSLMKSCDDVFQSSNQSSGQLLHASEKAVIAYCHLFHLLTCLARTDSRILRDATTRLQLFIKDAKYRTKNHNPDLGELIVLVMLVIALPVPGAQNPISWGVLNGPFLQETIVRNVRWVLKDQPDLEITEVGPNDYRLHWTFERSKTSLRLMMFQITFLEMFINTYASGTGLGLARLDDNYGFAERELPERMVGEIKAIYQVNSWPMFFQRVKYARGVSLGKERFSQMLRDAVNLSAQRKYHNQTNEHARVALRSRRARNENEWIQERAKAAANGKRP